MSEYLHTEKPFLNQLAAMGWQVVDQGQGVPQDPAASLRGSFREWILPEVFRASVRAINRMEDGRAWLTIPQLDELREQILRQPGQSLLAANEAIQKMLFKAQVGENELTGEQDPPVQLIDFEHPERNQFHAINQFRLDTPGCVKDFIIPDIVLFINGLPVAVVECKIGGITCANPMHEAFIQLQRYAGLREETQAAGLREGEPRLFHTNLMLIRSCGEKADYGTITSSEGHFAQWRLEGAVPAPGRAQEALVAGMLGKQDLCAILRACTVFMDTDSGKRVKVVCRYQQYRAARKILARLRQGQTPDERSGVVWHTQGSGKSLTMVFVARLIRASADLKDYKLVLVNDRVDLEDQLAETATLIGGKVNVIESVAQVRTQLGTDASDINMVMVHKFQERAAPRWPMMAAEEAAAPYGALPTAQTFGSINISERVLLMIDEAHRTQKGNESGTGLADNLFEAFPQATRIAFTGTPLIADRHGNRRTAKRFGDYIDTYKLMDAVKDGATLQILYEGRTADTALNEKHDFDTKFEDLFRDRSEAELLEIKKKYGATGDIMEAEKRIEAIAKDMVGHYVDQILPNGFKAQVVCHSKLAACRYQKAIVEALKQRAAYETSKDSPDGELIRQIDFLQAAVVISGGGTNEPAYVTQARKEALAADAVENFCKPFDFLDPAQKRTGIAFLVVCDMLLTGFDAPIEQVMYLDKKIQEHTLLQAIARVNRTAKGKTRGYVVDYIGLANHLKTALSIYSQTGEEKELDGLKNIQSEIPILEERYQRLIHFFVVAGIPEIEAFLKGELATPELEMAVVHQTVTQLKDIKLRSEFEVFLKAFLASLDIVLPHADANKYRVPAARLGYLLRMVKERYKDDSLDLGDAGAKVKQLINAHLVSLGINPKIPPIELLAPDFIEKLDAHGGENQEAKASEMEHAIRKHCTIHLDEDPDFYTRLSEKLDALLQRHRQQWDDLIEGMAGLREEAKEGRQEGIDGLSKEVSAFYAHIVREAFGLEGVPKAQEAPMKEAMTQVVDILRNAIGVVDFWNKPTEQSRIRARIMDVLLMVDSPQVFENRERLVIEIMNLARNRHQELLK